MCLFLILIFFLHQLQRRYKLPLKHSTPSVKRLCWVLSSGVRAIPSRTSWTLFHSVPTWNLLVTARPFCKAPPFWSNSDNYQNYNNLCFRKKVSCFLDSCSHPALLYQRRQASTCYRLLINHVTKRLPPASESYRKGLLPCLTGPNSPQKPPKAV